jgi:Holliday junction resolvasome RuvABC endonuclease subunit
VNLLTLKASKTRILRLIVELTTLILTFYVPELMKLEGGTVRSYFKTVLRLVDERGIAFTVKYVKSSRLAVTRYITGHPLDAVEGVALKDG